MIDEEVFLLLVRQRGRWLVENHDARVLGKRFRDLDQLAQAHGQTVHQGRGVDVDSDALEHAGRLGVHDPVGQQAQGRPRRPVQIEILRDRHVEEKVQFLVDEGYPRPVGVHRASGVVRTSLQEHLSAVSREHAAEDVHHRRLAGPVLAHEAENRSLGSQRKIDVLQDPDAGEALVKLLQGQNGCFHGAPMTVPRRSAERRGAQRALS